MPLPEVFGASGEALPRSPAAELELAGAVRSAGREGGGAVSGAEDRLRLDRPEAATTPVHRSQRGRS